MDIVKDIEFCKTSNDISRLASKYHFNNTDIVYEQATHPWESSNSGGKTYPQLDDKVYHKPWGDGDWDIQKTSDPVLWCNGIARPWSHDSAMPHTHWHHWYGGGNKALQQPQQAPWVPYEFWQDASVQWPQQGGVHPALEQCEQPQQAPRVLGDNRWRPH